MDSPVLGLHHVTATVNDAQADLTFFAGALGLRLVKRTINFDNPNVYHFYYGDADGTPGTIWTTFPYRGHGVRKGGHGSAQITTTSFSVPLGSLDAWKARLADRGAVVQDAPPRFGRSSITAADPSGLTIELVAEDDGRDAWTDGGVGADQAIRGINSVTLTVDAPDRTIDFMTRSLGFVVTNQAPGRTRVSVNGDAPGRRMEILAADGRARGVNGLGTVHHVAMAVRTADDQVRMRAELVRAGCHVTEVLDRQYFTSIYFREPGGVLFEIATVPPGFLIDEAPDQLGRGLKLPPWEEPHRAAIEAALAPVRLP